MASKFLKSARESQEVTSRQISMGKRAFLESLMYLLCSVLEGSTADPGNGKGLA
jgi:hypothetical protein